VRLRDSRARSSVATTRSLRTHRDGTTWRDHAISSRRTATNVGSGVCRVRQEEAHGAFGSMMSVVGATWEAIRERLARAA
jgi:hypothetical protein